MKILGKIAGAIAGRVSTQTVHILEAIDKADLITEFGEDALKALEQYEIVVPEIRLTIRRRGQ